MRIRIKLVTTRTEFQAVAIDEDDNVYPMNIDPIVLSGVEFPAKLVTQWDTALAQLEKAENERLAAQEAEQAQMAAGKAAKSNGRGKRSG